MLRGVGVLVCRISGSLSTRRTWIQNDCLVARSGRVPSRPVYRAQVGGRFRYSGAVRSTLQVAHPRAEPRGPSRPPGTGVPRPKRIVNIVSYEFGAAPASTCAPSPIHQLHRRRRCGALQGHATRKRLHRHAASALVKARSTAAPVTSRYVRRLVPGIGTTFVALRQHPRQRLPVPAWPTSACAIVCSGASVAMLRARFVASETRVLSPPVVRRQIAGIRDRPGQQAASKRRIGNKTDAQCAQVCSTASSGFARPQRIFALQARMIGCSRVRALDRADRSFG